MNNKVRIVRKVTSLLNIGDYKGVAYFIIESSICKKEVTCFYCQKTIGQNSLYLSTTVPTLFNDCDHEEILSKIKVNRKIKLCSMSCVNSYFIRYFLNEPIPLRDFIGEKNE